MFGYIIRRMVSAFLVVVLASMVVFAVFFFGPSNPAATICNESGRCTQERQEALEEAMGLNDPAVDAYATWVKGLFSDREITLGATYECEAPCLGISHITKEPVTDKLKEYFPATLSLAVGGAIVFLTLGVTTGVLAAKWRGTWADKAIVSSSLILNSIPYLLFALLAWIYLTQETSLFPETGYFPITEGVGAWFAGLLLPWLVIGVASSTAYARFTRGSMVETLGEDYVRTATAKGVSTNKVVYKHALRAGIVPIVTIFGLDFAALLAGTIVTEAIFEIDGIGVYGLEAVLPPQDLPVISATVLIGSVFVVTANLLVDIVYSFLDPRVRLV
jgi:peptide/nickel transport system permease protein